ncbi:MAG: c-type cytochrome [Anaerolineales bacterium]|nr:c-type cytochrome [Anaerolineales bacterium]
MKLVKLGSLFLLFAAILAACGGGEGLVSAKEYVLTTGIEDGTPVFLGVGDEINGMVNPELRAEPGETITVTLINGGEGRHQIVFPSLKVKTDEVHEKGESASVTFKAPNEAGELEYMDGNSAFEALGMKGVLVVAPAGSPSAERPAGLYVNELAVQAIQKGGCVACHVIPGVPGAVGTIGPDLSEIGGKVAERIEAGEYNGMAKTIEEYLHEAIQSPDAFIAPDCPTGPCGAGVMPASLAQSLSADELNGIVKYLASLPEGATAVGPGPGLGESEAPAFIGDVPSLTDEEFSWAKQTFFERCAGCHGTLRKGATGPALTPDVTLPKGTVGLAAIIFNGTTGGMPDWGKQGVLTQAETEVMAKFLQNEPPAPPEMSLEQMKASWQLITPVADRPTEPQTARDWQNYFIVTLRDAGQVAIIDGDTYEIVSTVDSGYAVHITRMSASGRYAYVIGRDGRLALIDLWMEKPEVVARVQTCYDARSVEVSKYDGPEGDFRDKYAITGCYWPPHFAVLDGQTLEPMKVVSTRSYTFDTGAYHPEPRVASILASHYKPEWVVNVKETGQIWLVNYTDPLNPSIKMINAALFLHDGGVDSTKRYFLVAANQSNKVAVVDLKTSSLAGIADVGAVPHPGRGANWIDPEFGPVWSTPHLGEASVMSLGTDPETHADNAWKAVRTTPLPGSGSLFIKTHPNSQWVWVDMTLNSDPVLARTICVIAKSDPSQVYKCWEIGTYGRAVHFEYNRDGTEVWVSLWGDASKPGETGAIVIYDDATLEEKARIDNLITPTGKFNVYNTVNDVY